MSLHHSEISWLVEPLQTLLQGARLQGLHDDGGHTLFLTLRAPGQTLTLLLSTHPRAARLHLIERRPHAPESPLSFTQRLRKLLSGRPLIALSQLPEERVVFLDFHEHRLVFELFGRRPNIALTGPERNVLQTLHPTRQPRLALHQPYTPPPQVGAPPSPPDRFPMGEDDALTQGRLVGDHYDDLITALEARERARRVRRATTRALDRARRTRDAVEADLERVTDADHYRVLGDLLAANLHRVERGMEAITVDNFYDGGAPITLTLEPRLDPGANLERLYRRYKRYSRAEEQVLERAEAAEARLTALNALHEELVGGAPALDAIEARLHELGVSTTPPAERQRARRQQRTLPYRAFRSLHDRPIWVGRSASANDRLTFTHARGSDLWLHAADWAGSHVILRVGKGEEPHPECVLDAATLAAHYSKGSEDTRVEVHITQQKHVKKHPGAPAGAVYIADARKRLIRIEPERLARLLDA